MPEQVGIKCRTLWNEWGEEYQGILTLEVENAPNRFTVEVKKDVSSAEHVLQPEKCTHPEQLQGTFDYLKGDEMEKVWPQGAK
eukprot:9156315-Pyramimonas_sp.AAC.1